jgi:glucosamine-6-phosphate isomerase
MELKIFQDYETLSDFVASEVLTLVKQKPEAVLCFASGDTPKLACQLIVQRANNEKVSFLRATFVGLDEWVGIPPENSGSCKYFFQQNLLMPLGMQSHQIHLFDGVSKNLGQECELMDDFIHKQNGIDLMVVGIGVNGHIGFNEPGVATDLYAHVASLHETTRTVGQKYFKGTEKLERGITLGLKHLTESKKVLLIANGEKKAQIIKATVEAPLSAQLPATILRTHANSVIAIDKAASALLSS